MAEFPPLIQALLDGKAYPEKPAHVDLVQTHLSFVFLLDGYVYKIKKPVNFGFVDFSTLEKRRFYCQQEVKLNSRLSPTVYLGVVEVVQNGAVFSIGGFGKVAEYAVKMRKLPLDRCLDRLLSENQVVPEMLSKVAQKLAEFHRNSESGDEISKYGGIETVSKNTGENFDETEKYIDVSIPRKTYETIKSFTVDFIESQADLFRQRIEGGRVKDCHGDLHLAHICFDDEIFIFDCIEFNDRFRYCDVASEIAFLAMDLDFHGRPDLSVHFVDSYVDLSGDQELLKLLNFYKCYRAYVRGKVESFKLDDPHVSEDEKARVAIVSGKYFDLAESYTFS
ncbi:MAG: hypothetical protein SVM79_08335 [Chloroflexota bacterium]|nr:hypothetical protein [Chloroflexota bacterium]